MSTINMNSVAIETDKALASILDNFSDEYIQDTARNSFNYIFRPYNTRMANFPMIINNQFVGIIDNYTGTDVESIIEKRNNIFSLIINEICMRYNLTITSDIPDEHLYSLCYALYQIFVSEFTDRVINFYSYYINKNRDQLIKAVGAEAITTGNKTAYTKKMYTDFTQVIVYENMEQILDIMAGLDIPLYNIIMELSDENTANFITSYISDCGDIYKNHISSYLRNHVTKTDMITAVKINFVKITSEYMQLSKENNPYIL